MPAGESTSAVAERVACDGSGCLLLGDTTRARPRLLCWPVNSGSAITEGRYGPQASTVEVSQALLRFTPAFATLRLDGTARLVSFARDCTGWQDIPLPVAAEQARLGAVPGGLLLATPIPAPAGGFAPSPPVERKAA
jgi:hypothetical protein